MQPTRITDHSSTVIDNIYGNNFEHDSYSGNILIKFADHFSQFLSISKEITKIKPVDVYKRDYSNFDENSFLDDISLQNWSDRNLPGTNAKFKDFLWRLEGCVDRHAPMKKLNKKQINKRSKPWINNFILKMIRHRDKLFYLKKNDPTNLHINITYKLFRNRIIREIRKAKKVYYKNYFVDNLNNMKKTWQGIKQLINMNNKSGPQITQINYKGNQINSNKEMADTFNNFFTDIGPNLDKEIPHCERPGGTNYISIQEFHIIF